MANIKEIRNDNDFKEFINREGTLNVVKVFGTWCQPCKLLTDIIIGLNPEEYGNTLFGEVNVDEADTEQICEDLNIRSIPVLVFYKNGEEVGRNVGLLTKDKLIEKLKEYGA